MQRVTYDAPPPTSPQDKTPPSHVGSLAGCRLFFPALSATPHLRHSPIPPLAKLQDSGSEEDQPTHEDWLSE
jgi:hypothetical protein